MTHLPKTKPYNLEAIQAGAKAITRDGRPATLRDISTMHASPVASFEAPRRYGQEGVVMWYVGTNGHDLDSMGSDLDVFILDEGEVRQDSLAMEVAAFAAPEPYDNTLELKPYQLSAEDSESYRNGEELFDKFMKLDRKLRELRFVGHKVYMCYTHSEEASVINQSPTFNPKTGVFLFINGTSSVAKGSITIVWTTTVWKHGFVSDEVAPINTADNQNCLCTFIPRYTPSGIMREYGIKYASGVRNLFIERKSEEADEVLALPAYSKTDGKTGFIQMGPSQILNVCWVGPPLDKTA